jgi:hypothetical protein
VGILGGNIATGLSGLADGGEHPSDCAPAPSTLTLKEVVALGIGPGIPVSHDHVGFPPVIFSGAGRRPVPVLSSQNGITGHHADNSVSGRLWPRITECEASLIRELMRMAAG